MAEDFIPNGKDESLAFYQNFFAQLQIDGGTYGVQPVEVTGYGVKAVNQAALNTDRKAKEQAFHVSVAAEDTNDKDTEKETRRIARIITNASLATDAVRVRYGLPVRDASPSSPAGGGITPATPAPGVLVNFGKRKQAIIAAGTNPQNGRLNKKYPGTKYIRIEYKILAGPGAAPEWKFLTNMTKSPFTHHLDNEEPVTIRYRACYEDSKGNRSGWTDAEDVVIGP